MFNETNLIDIKYLTLLLNNKLNEYGVNYGKKFYIVAEEGEQKEPIKLYGEKTQHYTSGVLSLTGSNIVLVRDKRFSTYYTQLTLFVDLQENGYFDKNSISYENANNTILAMLEDMNFYINEQITIGNATYNATATFSYPTTGARTSFGRINDCLPIYLSVEFAFFENGVSGENFKIAVNGYELPFTSGSLTRTNTSNSVNLNGDKTTKTYNALQSLSIDLKIPMLANNDFFKLVNENILFGGNKALSIKIEIPQFELKKLFIGTFGNLTDTIAVGSNIGCDISLIESVENMLDYDNNWEFIEETTNAGQVFLEKGYYYNIFWGDNDFDEITRIGEENYSIIHEYLDNKRYHKIRIFKKAV